MDLDCPGVDEASRLGRTFIRIVGGNNEGVTPCARSEGPLARGLIELPPRDESADSGETSDIEDDGGSDEEEQPAGTDEA